MIKHLSITISGRVQGVGFRWGAKGKAQEFGIAGFVKNMDDGTLYIEAEGEDLALQKFIVWCRKGPFWAKVKDMRVVEDELKNYAGFKIEH